jgi:hypothetical protein
MKIDRVTITGADNSIDPHDLHDLTKEFPFVEWGILVSKMAEGSNRFPDKDWLYDFSLFKTDYEKKIGLILKASCHVCGQWVRDLLVGGEQFIQDRGGWLDRFQRMQINTHAEKHEIDKDAFTSTLITIFGLNSHYTKQFIIQYDGVNEDLLGCCIEAGLDAVPLFDKSHGTGESPRTWPTIRYFGPNFGPPSKNVMMYCGYAGGLGPDNLEKELKRIAKGVDASCTDKNFSPIWIDMETKVRSNEDKQFDLDKVRACLEIAKPYTV